MTKKNEKNVKKGQSQNNKQANKQSVSNQNSKITKLEKEISKLQQELELEKNKKLQVMADFDNYKKRIEKEKATFGALTNLSLIQEILEVSDDIDLALNDQDLNLESAKEALKTAKEKLNQSINIAGVEKIEIKKGDDFDKEIMEAISVIPDENFKNKVIAVISSAYKYKGKDGVIRPARVIVGK